MGVGNVKGLPRYTKVIDASVQDDNPNLDFTEDKGTRITRAAQGGAVAAKDYSASALKRAEKEKAAAAAENEQLKAENEALQKRLAELEATTKPADPGRSKEEAGKAAESKKSDSKLPK